jgi:DNA-binding transcriptional regulator GbsR (MarR family)
MKKFLNIFILVKSHLNINLSDVKGKSIIEGKKIDTVVIKELTVYEKEFITCFQRFYELRGRSETLGLVFGLLFIRAPSSTKGLSQKEIAFLVDKSKSSVSRVLEILIDQGFCSYKLEDNEAARAERKYYIKGSFKELTIDRTDRSLKSESSLKVELKQIKNSIPKIEKQSHQRLLKKIDLFCDLIDVLARIHQYSLEVLRQHYQDDN